jgi:putative DNA primase/helicase
MSEYIIDENFDGDLEAVRKHYERLSDVYDNLATLGKHPTIGFAGNAGWYQDEPVTKPALLEDGWEKRTRCTTFERDLEAILDDQLGADDRKREVFNISSWKDADALTEPKLSTAPPEREWKDGKATPDYDELRGFGFWFDLDLDNKEGRTALTEDELRTIERVQQRVIEAVADAYDVITDDIYGLDSGGGAYIYGPPEATLPITEYLDAPERGWVLEDINDKINDGPLTEQVEAIIKDEGAGDLLDPDWIQNKNRQTKAPGAIHNSHDVVVTPLRDRHPDTGDPVTDAQYRPTLITQFADSDIASLEAWADGLTTIEHTDAVGPLLRTLYPEHIANTDGWRDIVDAVVDRCRREHDRIQERRQERAEAIEQQVEDETDGAIERPDIDADAAGSLRSSSGLVSGTEIVTSRSELSAAVDTIDVRDVIQNHASDRYDTSSRSHEVTFDPSWRTSGSGKSCAIPSGQNNFIDNGCNAGGGPVFAYALGEGIIRAGEKAPTRSLTAEEFGEALDAMRSDGYNIPVYVPAADDEYDQTPLWGLRKAALALGVVDSRDEFKEHETDDGETYLGFDAATYNSVLDALDDEDIDHGRTRVDTMTDRPTAGELGLGGVEEDPEQAAQNVLALLELTKTN